MSFCIFALYERDNNADCNKGITERLEIKTFFKAL
jgi:hypothetical protein